MKKIFGLALISLLCGGSVSHAQSNQWLYGSGPGGTPPFMYGSQPPPPPVYQMPPLAPLPQVPRIESYIPAPSGPSGYPCTMPGCR
jgi:hypothetical protein